MNAPAFSFKKLNIEKKLLVWFKINRLPSFHVVDRYMKTVAGLNVKNDGKGLDYFIPEGDEFDLRSLPAEFQKGYAAFVIAGTYYTKRLPVEKVVEICKSTNHPIILLGGKNEAEEANFIQSKSGENLLNLVEKLTLNQSASIVRDANLVLTNDTGLMHIAAAFHKKILSFWGNTVADFGMVPYLPHPNSVRVEVENLGCRPCSKLGYDHCPKLHFKCMKKIDTKIAVQWIQQNF